MEDPICPVSVLKEKMKHFINRCLDKGICCPDFIKLFRVGKRKEINDLLDALFTEELEAVYHRYIKLEEAHSLRLTQ